jgi:cell division protein FtsB
MNNTKKRKRKTILMKLIRMNNIVYDISIGPRGNYESEIAALKAEVAALKAEMEKKEKPKIICICGSTRFADLHAITRWELEKDGKAICLMINYLPDWYAKNIFGESKHDHYGEIMGNKNILDELHFRKIDLSDEIFVINQDGYIGESTRNEINYAIKTGKQVKYLEN